MASYYSWMYTKALWWTRSVFWNMRCRRNCRLRYASTRSTGWFWNWSYRRWTHITNCGTLSTKWMDCCSKWFSSWLDTRVVYHSIISGLIRKIKRPRFFLLWKEMSSSPVADTISASACARSLICTGKLTVSSFISDNIAPVDSCIGFQAKSTKKNSRNDCGATFISIERHADFRRSHTYRTLRDRLSSSSWNRFTRYSHR